MRDGTKKIKALLPEGYVITPSRRGGHLEVLKPDGEPLRTPTGVPIRISHSTGDPHTIENELARVRKALEGAE